MSKSDDGSPLMSHDYDGIQEYDNPLPGWWVYVFWITIIFSLGYWVYYHVGDGPSIWQSYDREMVAHYDLQAQALAAAGEITDESISKLRENTSMMSAARAIFGARCAVCHGQQAEGLIGPNLTDDYWLHNAQPTGIFKTISDGVPEKGMVSWKAQLSAAEMMSLAAYVGGLRGTNPPNPKAPQGELVASGS